ncbi:hypothetical protein pqer_cds_28 [Pandoravirus quercus]|uniref:Uncharacterized protein n=2 Tax=Pandoravirus TaxID=2060084 RepID=A0A2U7U7P7_9VIRU|nr:hypothetical protein pqer_cds_28 [Pandoravirus quercus]AVK74450.1 hypothetical protein pqer_cds_28 [Pandoravirus quercus]QBZ80621.1 hypothetical protein pclt_cds_21 [Pandoravirus celtis]
MDAEKKRTDRDAMYGPREREAIAEAARTGVLPFARDVIAAREDAFDRAIVRADLAKIVAVLKAMHGHGDAPADPLGPVGDGLPVPPTLRMRGDFGRDATLCASLLPDGSGWSVYRYDPQQVVEERYVGIAGMPWCTYCDGIRSDPPQECGGCAPWRAAEEPTHSTNADPWRHPIGVAWTWTHAEMEDYNMALRRASVHSYSYVINRRTVRQTVWGIEVSFRFYDGTNPDEEECCYTLHSSTDLWAARVVRRLVGHNPHAHCTRESDATMTPLDAHACVVDLAEARAAAERLAFVAEANRAHVDWGRAGPDFGAWSAWSLLRGWIAAVEALLRDKTFYLGRVAPYEARLIEAASNGLVSAD